MKEKRKIESLEKGWKEGEKKERREGRARKDE